MTKNPQTPAQILFAAITGLAAGMGFQFGMRDRSEPKPRKPVPTMVTASPKEIAAWNAAVGNRSDRLARIANSRRDHRLGRALHDSGQHPKFPKARVHKQHKHPLRDDNGAYTLIGRPYELENVRPASHEVVLTGWVDGDQFGYTVQRKWLAGISAQRGY